MSQETSFVILIGPPFEKSAREELNQQITERATLEAISTGILYRQSPQAFSLANIDGSEDSSPITQEEFESLLDEFSASVLPAADEVRLAGSSEARERAAAYREQGLIPIFVAANDFSVVRNRVWVAIEKLEAGGSNQPSWESPAQLFEERQAFMASAMLPPRFAAFAKLPYVHFGQQIRFVIPSDGLLGNRPVSGGLQADFGDGRGFREVRLDEPVEVTYAAAGTKILALRDVGSGGERTSYFRVTIEESIIDRLRRQGYVTEYRVEGAEVLIINKVGRSVTRPVLMVEGFPFNYPWDEIFKYANQQDFSMDLVENRDHQIVLVRFPGPIPIQKNALALVRVIQDVIKRRAGDAPLVIGGFSMGGLVARYALCYMETNNLDHQTSKFFTVDTPHEGANVSVAAQALIQILKPNSDEGKLMFSDAAQQSLLIFVPGFGNWQNGLEFGVSQLRVDFLKDLQSVGFMPKKMDTIAIANGEGKGRFNFAKPGADSVGYNCQNISRADLRFSPDSVGVTVLSVARNEGGFRRTPFEIKTRSKPVGYDSAPGGIWEKPIFATIYDNFKPAGNNRTLYVGNGCFIPTLSALGIKGDDYFTPLNEQNLRDRSYFKKVTYHPGNAGEKQNEVHVTLTKWLSSFLRFHVFGIPIPKDAEGPEA